MMNDEITNSIDDLNKLLTHFLDRQPKLTRGFSQKVREMEGWLTAAPQGNKMQRVTVCQIVTQRLKEGREWFDQYSQMSLSLSKVYSLLPKVQVGLGDCTDLLAESKTLVTSRELFWTLFETWLKQRVTHYVDAGDNGLDIVRTIVPKTQELLNQTFVDIRQTVRSECVLTLWCYVTT